VVIGGQTLSLLLTLIATPVVYSLLDDMRHTGRWRSLATSMSGLRGRFANFGRRPVEPVEPAAAERAVRDRDREEVGAGASGD
jgi:hypothetical protein